MRARAVLLATGLLAVATTAASLPGGRAPGAGDPGLVDAAAALLSRRCLVCHNPGKASGGVDFSTRVSATRTRPSGAALVPREPQRSRLFQMVSRGKMPPAGRLPAAEINLLRQWIAAGGAYASEPLAPPAENAVAQPRKTLWALKPVVLPPVPRSRFDRLARNPVDRFIFAALEKHGLQPSPPASRRALIRRLTIDLTGLPPTPTEVRDFLADRSADAYDKVVDRLLASPAYGERWARHWLDVVRYGESNGYEQNHLRTNAWPYRDYVIRSFNDDKPYLQFVAEQLAGDVLAKGDPDVEAATGFLVAGVHDTVGIQTLEGTLQQRANDLDDIVATTGAAFLGLTVGCARCHDHKFDPIPQRDYYRFAAVFAGVRHGERSLGSSMTADERKSGRTEEGPAGAAAPGKSAPSRLPSSIRILEGRIATIDLRGREAVLRAQGTQPVPHPAVSARWNLEEFPPARARFVRLTIEATRDGTQPCLDEMEIYGPGSDENLALASRGAKATASSLLPGYDIHQVAHLNDGRWGNEWSWISNEPGRGWAQIELPVASTIARIVWSRDGSARPRFTDRVPSAYRVEASEDGRQWKELANGADRAPAPEAIPPERLQAALSAEDRERRASLAAELDRLRQSLDTQHPSPDTRLAYIGRFSAPDPIFLLKRGDVMQRGEPVAPAALSAVPGLDGEFRLAGEAPEPERRLALARWITSARNPLTPRVIVNRIWQHHFGRGLVGTPSDFGLNGEPPTHPELLDWLASALADGGAMEYRSSGVMDRSRPSGSHHSNTPLLHHSSTASDAWRLKSIHRLLVSSYTYRQSSAPNPRGTAVDTSGRYLWRMPLRRMEAEAIRDSILAVSGKLDCRMGGPGFQLFNYRVVNVAIYESLEQYGPETWRRSIYSQAARAIRDDLLGGFDCPECSQRAPRREVTTTPLQALSLLNGPFALQQAEFMAERVRREAGGGEKSEFRSQNSEGEVGSQVELVFELALGRPPTAAERRESVSLVQKRGLAPLCRALLNANEFLYY